MNKEYKYDIIIVMLCVAIILCNIATMINTNKINKLRHENKCTIYKEVLVNTSPDGVVTIEEVK